MLLVLVVGPDLVSQDLRFNALPLYFSRPLRRIDYFLGKLGVIALFLAAVAVVPAVAAYLLGVAFSLDFAVVRDTWRSWPGPWLRGGGGGLGRHADAGALVAVAQLAARRRVLVGLWVVGNVRGRPDPDGERDWCTAGLYTTNLDRLREECSAPRRRAKFLALWESGRRAGREAAGAALPFGRNRRRRFATARRRPASSSAEARGRSPRWDDQATGPLAPQPEHLGTPGLVGRRARRALRRLGPDPHDPRQVAGPPPVRPPRRRPRPAPPVVEFHATSKWYGNVIGLNRLTLASRPA